MLSFEDLRNRAPRHMTNEYGWRLEHNIYYRPVDKACSAYVIRKRTSAGPIKTEWTFLDLFQIDGYDNVTPIGDPQLRSSASLSALGITVQSARTKAHNGVEFHWISGNRVTGFKRVTTVGAFPIQVVGGQLIVSKPGVRTIDEEKRRAFNAKLREIRNVFRIRAKLGVFDNFHIQAVRKKYYKDNASFVKLLMDVDVSNLDTFEPILGAMFQYFWPHNSVTISDTKEDLLKRFDLTVDRFRESCKRELDVVTYV